jgi:hypothetical protein
MRNWRSDMKQISIRYLLYRAHIYVFAVRKLHVDINIKNLFKLKDISTSMTINHKVLIKRNQEQRQE